jgi:2'-5' RNA ligase
MNHRIFIAVNLPDDVRKQLSGYQDKWPDLPISWTKKYNLHITLAFLGYVSDEDIMDVCKTVGEISSKNNSFSVNLNKISYGPPKKIPPKSMNNAYSFPRSPIPLNKDWVPRMVWAEGEESESLGKIQKELEDALFKNSIKGIKLEKRKFTPHITLGRIKTWQWQKLEPEERPEVNEKMNLEFDVNSIEVMESFLKRGGPEYTILESYVLADNN